MAGTIPFEPNVKTAAAGFTVAVASSATNTSIPGTVDSTGGFAPSILVTNQGPNLAWVRMSSEATPTATGSDTPMLGNTVRLFGNPVPTGKLGVAIIVSVTTSPNTVFFTIGQGGLVP